MIVWLRETKAAAPNHTQDPPRESASVFPTGFLQPHTLRSSESQTTFTPQEATLGWPLTFISQGENIPDAIEPAPKTTDSGLDH